jgi:F0F1-type ATP synthase assembly protein I
MTDELGELKSKINSMRSEIEEAERPQTTHFKGADLAWRITLELVGCVGVAMMVGYFLDVWLDTSPFLFILCILFGAAAGFVGIIRIANAASKRYEENQ